MDTSIVVSPSQSHTIPAVISTEFLALLRAHDVRSAHLFGSVAHGDARPESDLDLLVAFNRPVSLFAQLRLAEELSRLCGRSVDLIVDLHPAFAPYIIPTLVALPL